MFPIPFLRLLSQTGRSGFNSWPKSAAPLLQPLLSKAAANDLQIAPKIDCNTNDRCFVLFLVIQSEAIGRGGDAVVVADIPAKVQRARRFSSDKGSSQLAINCRLNLNS